MNRALPLVVLALSFASVARPAWAAESLLEGRSGPESFALVVGLVLAPVSGLGGLAALTGNLVTYPPAVAPGDESPSLVRPGSRSWAVADLAVGGVNLALGTAVFLATIGDDFRGTGLAVSLPLLALGTVEVVFGALSLQRITASPMVAVRAVPMLLADGPSRWGVGIGLVGTGF